MGSNAVLSDGGDVEAAGALGDRVVAGQNLAPPVSAAATWSAVHVGWAWRSSAAAPATCGAAMLVPLSSA